MATSKMKPDQPIKVLIVDDHPLMREGIAAAIKVEPDMVVAGDAADGDLAIDQFFKCRPDVTLMDLQMPNRNGIDAVMAIRQTQANAKILVLTTYGGDAYAERALRAGAMGFLLKSTLHRELVQAIRMVHSGHRYVQQDVARELVAHIGEDRLSQREIDVLRQVAEGHGNKSIARLLSISEQTVKAHLKNVFLKLDVADRTQAVVVGLRRGLIDI